MKIFYHTDNDGKAAAHMVYLYLKNKGIEVTKEDFYSVNYNNRIPSADFVEKGEGVYIVDYSFTEATYSQLANISFKANGDVVWFDHHKTSLEILDYVKSIGICKNVVVDMNRSGAMIAYDELIAGTELDTDAIKKVITLVDDYDRWVHKFPESKKFNYGSIMHRNGPLDSIWTTDPEEVIKKGEVIEEYVNASANKNCKRNKYFIKINDKRCIVLNTSIASSSEFGEYYDKYKLAIRWSFNGTNYSYSIYSELEDIDCATIAKHFNPSGGGHKGAAGFVSDKLEFKDGYSFRIRMPK